MLERIARNTFIPLLVGLQLVLAAPLAWSGEGEVSYHARDQAASWSGVAPIGDHEAHFDPDNLASLRLEVQLAPASFNSGNGLRDAQARRTVFDVNRFPEARLEAAAASGTPSQPLVAGVATEVTLEGDLTLHGVTRRYPIVLQLLLSVDAAGTPTIEAEGAFVVSLEAHGMRRPWLLGLLTEDEVRVEVRVLVRPLTTPTATTRR
jgi:polyisoprenoid-binding protein YceI